MSVSLRFLLTLALSGGFLAGGQDANAEALPDVRASVKKSCTGCLVDLPSRRVLGGSVVEYTFDVQVGAGDNDVIRIHRVVAEEAPFIPARTAHAVFMAHGDAWGFDAAFLGSIAALPNHALPVYLADRGVDVWGIDFRWALVGADVTDFSFMAGWDLATDAADLGTGLEIATAVRKLEQGGPRKMPLLGWSRGGQISYAYLNLEAQRSPNLRRVNAFIPVDIYLKTDVPERQAAACQTQAGLEALITSGQFADSTGGLLIALGQLATFVPMDPSPIIPGLTNAQAAVFAGALTFQLFPPGAAPVPTYHLVAGTYSPEGFPTGLANVDESTWFSILSQASPWQSMGLLADAAAVTCDSQPTAYDDHLADIDVPVLYVGAGGGFGESGLYTVSLLGTTDVTTVIGSFFPPEYAVADLGHSDIFNGANAESIFWAPILSWLEAH